MNVIFASPQKEYKETIVGAGSNYHKEPVELYIDEQINLPLCPSCGELPFSLTCCVFCGQHFMPYKYEPKFEYIGATWSEEKQTYICDSCKEDINLSSKLVGFTNDDKFPEQVFSCVCGNTIRLRLV